MKENRGLKKAFPIVMLILLFVVWVNRFSVVNQRAIRVTNEIFPEGDSVEIGNNFFFDASEDANGYTVRINKSELISYEDFCKTYNCNISSETSELNCKEFPEYILDLSVTFTNINNENGHILLRRYALICDALEIPINHSLLSIISPKISKGSGFMIPAGESLTIHLPFTPMDLHQSKYSKKIFKSLVNRPVFLCVSEFPSRKLIRIQLTENENQ